jgi:polyhydroxyalkanoate synthesis regulator phasin
MKDELKNILLMGLGAMSLTNEKAKELRTKHLQLQQKSWCE